MRTGTAVVALLVVTIFAAGCGSVNHSAVSSEVTTVRCPTTFGLAGEKLKPTSKTIAVTLTAAVATQVEFYVGGLTVLGPAGWKCDSSVGVDGSASITVHPPGESATNPAAGISVSDVPACQGCMADLVCPFFTNAETQLGYSLPCSGSVPEGETIAHMGRNVISFLDPAGIKGNGFASGDKNPARGLAVFLPPYAKRQDRATLIECTLSQADKPLCTAIFDNYLDGLKRQSGRQFVAAWPAVTATTTTASPGTAPGAAQPGFLAYASNGVLFIQWTRTGNSVTGTLSESYTDPSNASHVTNESHSFTGVISGSSVTLTLDSGDNWNGTLTSSGVTLSYAGSDGTLHTFPFNKATVADYNSAVSGVATQSQTAAHAQAQQQATQQAQQTLNGDANALASDISTLRTDISQLNTDLSQVPSDLTQMRADLATQEKDLNQLLAARTSGCQNGGDYQVASTDNYQVTSTDDYQITSTDAYSLNNDQQAISSAIATLRSDNQKEASDQNALPTYTPTGLPTTSEIQDAINTASAAARTARTKWAGDLAVVKQLDSASNGYASKATHTCGS